MGQGLSLRINSVPPSEVAKEQTLAEVLEARDRLLREHPELMEFQKEIDRRLAGAGTPENRMAVLGIMMAAKVQELSQRMRELLEIVGQVKK